MAFDPTKPANGSPIVAVELRSQFAGLKTLLDATQSQVDGLPTQNDLTSAINDCPLGVNSISPLVLGISNPPTQAQVQAILTKLNELINGLYRS